MSERWKDVEGYEGRYQVSDHGNVMSMNYHREGKPRLLKPGSDKDGYKQVLLYNGTGRTTARVHILVARAFLEPDPDRDQVNHKNGITSDNVWSNLEWATALEQLMHSFKHLGRTVAKGAASKCAKEYVATDPSGKEHHVKGLKAFCIENGLLQGEMTNVVSGRAKTHRGWRCRRKEDYDDHTECSKSFEGCPDGSSRDSSNGIDRSAVSS